MGLTTVMVLDEKVEALPALQGTVMRVAMIALKLMGVAAAPAGALGMMTGAPLMKMMTITATRSHLKKHFSNKMRSGHGPVCICLVYKLHSSLIL